MAKGQSLQNGSTLGAYSIVRLIGKGGMGEVYEARDVSLKRRVALKVINPEFIRDPEIITRFEIEGQTLAKGHHRNLVMIYSFGIDKGLHFLAMEYVEGESIADYLKTSRFSPQDAIPMFLEALDGVQYLHRCGVVHRDLKPGNIILSTEGTIKIVDFGIAKDFDSTSDLTRAGSFIGSVHYAAPEIAAGRECSRASDVFSLGVIFYEMLVGKRPFQGKALMEVLEKVKYEPMQFPEKMQNAIPFSLQTLIYSMCVKSEDQRTSDIPALRAELKRILNQDFQSGATNAEPKFPSDDKTLRLPEPVSSSGSNSNRSRAVREISPATDHSSPFAQWNFQAVLSHAKNPKFLVIVLILVMWGLIKGTNDGDTNQSFPDPAKYILPIEKVPSDPTPSEPVDSAVQALPRIEPVQIPEPKHYVKTEPLPTQQMNLPQQKPKLPSSTATSRRPTIEAARTRPVAKKPESSRLPSTIDSKLSTPALEPAIRLAAPELKAPRNGTIVLSSQGQVPVVFLWKSVDEAKYYEIQFAADSSFTAVFYSKKVRSPRFIYNGAFPQQSIYWRVRARKSDAQSNWTEPYQLQKSE